MNRREFLGRIACAFAAAGVACVIPAKLLADQGNSEGFQVLPRGLVIWWGVYDGTNWVELRTISGQLISRTEDQYGKIIQHGITEHGITEHREYKT